MLFLIGNTWYLCLVFLCYILQSDCFHKYLFHGKMFCSNKNCKARICSDSECYGILIYQTVRCRTVRGLGYWTTCLWNLLRDKFLNKSFGHVWEVLNFNHFYQYHTQLSNKDFFQKPHPETYGIYFYIFKSCFFM